MTMSIMPGTICVMIACDQDPDMGKCRSGAIRKVPPPTATTTTRWW